MTDRIARCPGGVDALAAEALAGVDLPTATKRRLMSGVPRELRLPRWLGPTLFSSELSTGRLAVLGDLSPRLADHPHVGSLVVATVRETVGTPAAYAAFCLQPTTGSLWLVVLDEPWGERFVNATLDQFFACVRAFLDAWPRVRADPEADLPALVSALRGEWSRIDATACADEDHYWPTTLDGHGLEDRS